MFQVSDKVVCLINYDHIPSPHHKRLGQLPRRMVVYVVEKTGLAPNKEGISLVGSTSFWAYDGEEVGFNQRNFRKLSEVQEFNRNLKELSNLLQP